MKVSRDEVVREFQHGYASPPSRTSCRISISWCSANPPRRVTNPACSGPMSTSRQQRGRVAEADYVGERATGVVAGAADRRRVDGVRGPSAVAIVAGAGKDVDRRRARSTHAIPPVRVRSRRGRAPERRAVRRALTV